MTTDLGDKASRSAIDSALGVELKLARTGRGWSKTDVVVRMTADIAVQTYANYEYGLRPCTLERLHDICQALNVSTSHLVALALFRAGWEPSPDEVVVDLVLVLDSRAAELEPLRRWARHRRTVGTANGDVAVVQRPVLVELAAMLGFSYEGLCRRLRRFMPRHL